MHRFSTSALCILFGVVGLSASLLMAACIRSISADANIYVLVCLSSAAAIAVPLAAYCRSAASSSGFSKKIAEELDHIMIGSAETSYFVDSIKKKISQDVGTTN